MSKQFIVGNVYVFTKKKYMEDKRKTRSKSFGRSDSKMWVDMINGNKVTVEDKHSGNVGRLKLYVCAEWCKCIKNNNLKVESEAI